MSTIILLTENKEAKIYTNVEKLEDTIEQPIVPEMKISKICPNDRDCLLLDSEETHSAMLIHFDLDRNPQVIGIPVPNIDDIAKGLKHSVVLDFEGKVWIFGYLCKGLNFNNWQEIDGLPRIRKIFSHANASYFQDYDDNFWLLGVGPFNRLEGAPRLSPHLSPHKLSFDFQVRDISGGDADHLLVTDKEGNVYGIGANWHKQMFNNYTVRYDHLVPLPFPKAKKTLAVGHCSVVLDYEGNVWISGELFSETHIEMEKFDKKYIVDIELFVGSALCMIDIEGNLWIYGYLDGTYDLVEFKEPKVFHFGDLIAWNENIQRSLKSAK